MAGDRQLPRKRAQRLAVLRCRWSALAPSPARGSGREGPDGIQPADGWSWVSRGAAMRPLVDGAQARAKSPLRVVQRRYDAMIKSGTVLRWGRYWKGPSGK